jgi:hypothetical protein
MEAQYVAVEEADRGLVWTCGAAFIATRYPADLAQLLTQYSAPVARTYLEQTREIITWLRQDPRLQTS